MSLRENVRKRIVVWPSYLDARIPRGRGRKVPLRYAVKTPKVEEVEEAARRLGLEVEVIEKWYPKCWWLEKKCVIVEKRGSKLYTLKLIADEIRRMRGGS